MKVLSNPLLLKQFLPRGLSKLKASSKLFVDHGGFGSLGAQFKRHGFQINQPISYQNTRLSQFRRRLTVGNAVIGLSVTNVAVFLLWRVADSWFMVQNFMIGHQFGPEFLLKLCLAGTYVGSAFFLVHHAFLVLSSKSVNALNVNQQLNKCSREELCSE